jgi:hypothetical protein
MNMETHNRYFRDIAYNQDSMVSWPAFSTVPDPLNPYGSILLSRYEARVEDLIKKCHHVTNTQELMGRPGAVYHDDLERKLCADFHDACQVYFVFGSMSIRSRKEWPLSRPWEGSLVFGTSIAGAHIKTCMSSIGRVLPPARTRITRARTFYY